MVQSKLDYSKKINLDVIKRVIAGQFRLAKEEAKALILNSRKERRAQLMDPIKYANIVEKFYQDLDNLYDKY